MRQKLQILIRWVFWQKGEGDPAPISILLGLKQHHMNNEQFEKLREGYNIKVKILGKRFDSGESHISIIGMLEK